MISCKKDEKPTFLKDEPAGQQPSVAVNNTPSPSLLNQVGIQSAAPAATTTAPGMNPPHGQPGHTCEIPVGQPLNGTPPATQNPSAQKNITVNGNNTIQIDPNSVSPGKIMTDNKGKQVQTAPGMNPPHGQPGHSCEIPVGQPLNSKPSKPAPVQNTPVPVPQPAVANNGQKPKLNPAHGEPFHECAKKVGDPL